MCLICVYIRLYFVGFKRQSTPKTPNEKKIKRDVEKLLELYTEWVYMSVLYIYIYTA